MIKWADDVESSARVVADHRVTTKSVSCKIHNKSWLSIQSIASTWEYWSNKAFISWLSVPRIILNSASIEPIVCESSSKMARDPCDPQITRIWRRLVFQVIFDEISSCLYQTGSRICPITRAFIPGKYLDASSYHSKIMSAIFPRNLFAFPGIVSDSCIASCIQRTFPASESGTDPGQPLLMIR